MFYRIVNKRRFAGLLTSSIAIVFVVSLVLFLWKGGPIGAYITFLFLFAIIMLSKKFTTAVNLDDTILTIEYVQWLKKKAIKFRVPDIEVKMNKTLANRAGTTFLEMKIIAKNNPVYSIRSNDGFEESSLIELASQIEKARLAI